MNNDKEILSQQEIKFLIGKLISYRKKQNKPEPSEEECINLIKWATESVIGYTLLDLIFKNYLEIDVLDGEPVFSNPNYIPQKECMDEKEKFDNRKLLNEGLEIIKDMTKNIK